MGSRIDPARVTVRTPTPFTTDELAQLEARINATRPAVKVSQHDGLLEFVADTWQPTLASRVSAALELTRTP